MNNNALEKPLVSIIIVNYNGIAYTRGAVLSIRRHSPSSEIIVVDNCSTDGSVEALKDELSPLTVLSMKKNKGFGYGCNRGAEAATGKYLFFLNNDALISENTPNILASFLETHPTVAACGPRLMNHDGSFQLSIGLDPSLFSEWTIRRWQRQSNAGELLSNINRKFADKPVDWITGAALMVRRDVFERIGGFDESFFMYFEDADLCRRIRNLGLEVLYIPQTSLTHLGGRSYGNTNKKIDYEYRRSQLRIYDKSQPLFARLVIRLYLLAKFILKLSNSSERQLSASVIALLFRDQGR